MALFHKNYSLIVNCRIGSLEIDEKTQAGAAIVNCRIGSLEILSIGHVVVGYVNCRIGSLENTQDRQNNFFFS